MLNEPWVLACLLAMLANVIKVLMVKTRCREIDSWALLFYARLFPGVLLGSALLLIDFEIHAPLTFWSATSAAALITIGASLLYMEAVKMGEVSLVTPIQATIPLFMVLCTYLVYGEAPSVLSSSFMILIVMAVSLVMADSAQASKTNATPQRARAVWFSLAAAALFGVSTVLDRVAIAAASHGALVFSASWNALTLLMLIPVLLYRRQTVQWQALRDRNVNYYALAVLVAFIAQQYAVQWSLEVENGVTYVKTIVMGHIVIASAIGMHYLQERVSRKVWLANAVTVMSGVGLLWSI